MIKMKNSAMEMVYRNLDELNRSIEWDTYNLSRDDQSQISLKIQELRNLLNQKYGSVTD